MFVNVLIYIFVLMILIKSFNYFLDNNYKALLINNL